MAAWGQSASHAECLSTEYILNIGRQVAAPPNKPERDRGAHDRTALIECPACRFRIRGSGLLSEGIFRIACPRCGTDWSVQISMWVSRLVVDRTGFRKELRAGLARRGISQTRLAGIIGVTPSYVSMVISGRRLPAEPRRWLAAVGVHEVPMVFPKASKGNNNTN